MTIELNAIITGQYLRKLYECLFESLLEIYELSQIEVDIMLFLANNPSYDTARDIVERRCLTKSHISSAVEKLIQKGYLIREIDRSDRRCVHLKLQKKAEPIIEEGKNIQDIFVGFLYKGVSEEEKKKLDELLKRIRENVKNALKTEKGEKNK